MKLWKLMLVEECVDMSSLIKKKLNEKLVFMFHFFWVCYTIWHTVFQSYQ